MRALVILSLLLLIACRRANESTIRGNMGETDTTTAASTPTETSRGAMETQSEAPLETTGTSTTGTEAGTQTAPR